MTLAMPCCRCARLNPPPFSNPGPKYELSQIETAMAAMDDKVAQYRKETLERKPAKGIESLLKRLTARIK